MLKDDGETMYTAVRGGQAGNHMNVRKPKLLRIGAAFLAIVFLGAVVSVTVFKAVPHRRRLMRTTVTEQDMQEVLLKAMFSTDHIPVNKDRSLNIINLDYLTDELKLDANRNSIRVINAFFRSHSISKGIICKNPLSGYLLEVNIYAMYSRKCSYQDQDMCRLELQEQLRKAFSPLLIPINVQFEDKTWKRITMKICSITEMTHEEELRVSSATKTKAKQAVMPYAIPEYAARQYPEYDDSSNTVPSRSRCAFCINKIGLVQMDGEDGSRIRDDLVTYALSVDRRNGQYLTAVVYEESAYRFTVQLDCGGYFGNDRYDSACSSHLSLSLWIDYNDNGVDDGESRILAIGWAEHDKATGLYNLEIRVPRIDESHIRAGPHCAILSVVPSDKYQRDCGSIAYKETREYTVDVKRRRYIPSPTTTPPACPVNLAKIILVIMAGEKGTEIRDDQPSTPLAPYQNQHHIAVTLFEHTVYLIRIQLDCSTQLRTELTANGCNLAQDVNVWIDLNDDGKFDQSEMGAPHRWPVTSYLAEGIYDMQIYVPAADSLYGRNRQHKMRIAVTPSEYYQTMCASHVNSETREYLVTIIPRMKYSTIGEPQPNQLISSNIACSPDVGRVILVVMAGEHRTQIRDDESTHAALRGNTYNHQHMAIMLYEDTVYLLRIQLECTTPYGRDYVGNNCNLPHDVTAWIDLNNDGRYDDSENAAPYRWPLSSYVPKGVYDLQIYVPNIDGARTKSGPHRMRVDVMLNEQYRQKCGKNYYKDTREYNVTIVRNSRPSVDLGGPYLTLSDSVCSQTISKIVLVIMAGEQGTHIRDDTPANTVIRENQNQHHMSVTAHENTYYRLRVQLDCDQRSSRSTYKINCNLIQDVNVLIDLNNDGVFDESESRVPQRWPPRNSMAVGIYDFEIYIPSIDAYNMKGGSHRMRIVVRPGDEYDKKCGRSQYSETREYTVHIISKPGYVAVPETRATHCSAGNLICSGENSAMFLVTLSGEQNTQIRDDTKQCSSTNNYNDQTNLAVTLFDNTAYSLRVELYCAQQNAYGNSYGQYQSMYETECNDPRYLGVWIDFDNDGLFDQNTEQLIPNSWYRDDPRATHLDLNINIPQIDGRTHLEGQHRMRIVLVHDDRNRRACQSSGYGEVRDYTVNIMRKPYY